MGGRLDGKTAIVIGAAQGIGAGIAEVMAEPIFRREFEQQKVRPGPVILMALNIDRRREHPIRRRREQTVFGLHGERMTVLDAARDDRGDPRPRLR